MKRKGFTLVELLIVVAILGALAAIMTVSSGASISKSKATAIANNLRICTTATQLYALQSGDTEAATTDTAADKLSVLVPNFSDFTDADNGMIKYTATGEGYKNWAVSVDIGGASAAEIETALKTIKGFSNASKHFTYNLFDGKVKQE